MDFLFKRTERVLKTDSGNGYPYSECTLCHWTIKMLIMISFMLHILYHIINERVRQWRPTPVLLPGKSHGRRSLVGCSPWVRWELDKTEWLLSDFSLSCIREGNGNPLQCSCLENPRDRGAWWAAVHGVARSWIRLKPLSSSSSFRKISGALEKNSNTWAFLFLKKFQDNSDMNVDF